MLFLVVLQVLFSFVLYLCNIQLLNYKDFFIMKKIFLFALLAFSSTAFAQTTEDDEKEGKCSSLLVLSKDETSTLSMHLAVGVNLATNVPADYKFAPFKSWDISWTVFEYGYTPKGASQTYSVGLGLTWRNYGLKDNYTMFVKNDQNNVELGTFDGDMESRYSRLRTWGISLPLLFTQRIGKNFSFSLGPVMNLNLFGRINTGYKIGDDKTSISTKNIGYRPFTVDVMGVFNIYGVGVYCKYSPMSVMKKDRGPQFKSVTVGLYL